MSGPGADFWSPSPMGEKKPTEDIESCRVQADQSKSIHRARVNEHRRLRSIKFIIALTTEPSGPSNPDTEDPQLLPARPSYSQGLVCSPRRSDAPGDRPARYAPNPAPSAVAFADHRRA